MTDKETTMDILKNTEKYVQQQKVSELLSAISTACGIVNQNPEVFDYATFRKPLEKMIHLCIDWQYKE